MTMTATQDAYAQAVAEARAGYERNKRRAHERHASAVREAEAELADELEAARSVYLARLADADHARKGEG